MCHCLKQDTEWTAWVENQVDEITESTERRILCNDSSVATRAEMLLGRMHMFAASSESWCQRRDEGSLYIAQCLYVRCEERVALVKTFEDSLASKEWPLPGTNDISRPCFVSREHIDEVQRRPKQAFGVVDFLRLHDTWF